MQKQNNQLPTHGTLLSINGLGVMLTGESGIGKSECALALIKEGAKLICDDAPIFKVKADEQTKAVNVMGYAGEKYPHQIFIRQLGLIDIASLFPDATSLEVPLELIIELTKDEKLLQTTELKPIYKKIAYPGGSIDKLCLSVAENRNISLLINLAVKQFALQRK